jgi:hypothetical protein
LLKAGDALLARFQLWAPRHDPILALSTLLVNALLQQRQNTTTKATALRRQQFRIQLTAQLIN